MKFQYSALLALAATVAATPAGTKRQTAGCTSAVTLSGSENPFKKYTLHANQFYRKEVEAAVAQLSDPSLADAAKKVADVGSFLWM
jgi:cellulose 1,4-beta-cellobiosidase